MTQINRAIVALFLVAAACGGKSKKKPDTLIEADQAGESCCCRIEGDTPEDVTFTRSAVMECSSRHGTCIKSEARCEGQPDPDVAPPPDDGALPPVVEETPTSF